MDGDEENGRMDGWMGGWIGRWVGGMGINSQTSLSSCPGLPPTTKSKKSTAGKPGGAGRRGQPLLTRNTTAKSRHGFEQGAGKEEQPAEEMSPTVTASFC